MFSAWWPWLLILLALVLVLLGPGRIGTISAGVRHLLRLLCGESDKPRQ
ncbi:MAG: hypothetical protein HGA45_29665 [Chloroflexales bacterium]|nr:hypothetical protein [Chloroflexales bacterium]